MKKTVGLFAVACLGLPTLFAQTPGFRNASWGMTVEETKKLEAAKPDREDKEARGLDMIVYIGKADALSCAYGYIFADDKLVEGRYRFIEKHTNNNQYIEDFNVIKASLVEKYGKPKSDETIWYNNLYKSDPNEWGFAVSLGHLAFQAVWQTANTKILLQLQGDNYEFTHLLQYASTSKEHLDLIKKAEAKAKKGIW